MADADSLGCCFAVASDDELPEGDEPAEGGACGPTTAGPAAAPAPDPLPGAANMLPRPPRDASQAQEQQQQQRQHQALGQVANRLLQLDSRLSSLATAAQRKAAAAAAAADAAPAPLQLAGAGASQQIVPQGAPAAVPSPPREQPEPAPCALACPQPNSSLLLGWRKQLLERQVRYVVGGWDSGAGLHLV